MKHNQPRGQSQLITPATDQANAGNRTEQRPRPKQTTYASQTTIRNPTPDTRFLDRQAIPKTQLEIKRLVSNTALLRGVLWGFLQVSLGIGWARARA
jgi:hypothetical protein